MPTSPVLFVIFSLQDVILLSTISNLLSFEEHAAFIPNNLDCHFTPRYEALSKSAKGIQRFSGCYLLQPSYDIPVCSNEFVVAAGFVPLCGDVHIDVHVAKLHYIFCLCQATFTWQLSLCESVPARESVREDVNLSLQSSGQTP
jgi:hypothetical protein